MGEASFRPGQGNFDHSSALLQRELVVWRGGVVVWIQSQGIPSGNMNDDKMTPCCCDSVEVLLLESEKRNS